MYIHIQYMYTCTYTYAYVHIYVWFSRWRPVDMYSRKHTRTSKISKTITLTYIIFICIFRSSHDHRNQYTITYTLYLYWYVMCCTFTRPHQRPLCTVLLSQILDCFVGWQDTYACGCREWSERGAQDHHRGRRGRGSAREGAHADFVYV